MIHDGLYHAQDLHTHIFVFFALDLLEADVEQDIQVIDIEEVLWLFLRQNDRNRVEALVEAVTVATVGQVQELLTIEVLWIFINEL